MRETILFASAMMFLITACERTDTEPVASESGLTDADAGPDAVACSASTAPTCVITSTDEEQGTMTVRCDSTPDSNVACRAVAEGEYACDLGCLRTPSMDCAACAPSRAYQCAPGYVPNDCEDLGDGSACCL